MKALLLVVLLWIFKYGVSKLVSGWDQRLSENEIYYAENNIYYDGNAIDWNEMDEARMSNRNWFLIFPGDIACTIVTLTASSTYIILHYIQHTPLKWISYSLSLKKTETSQKNIMSAVVASFWLHNELSIREKSSNLFVHCIFINIYFLTT